MIYNGTLNGHKNVYGSCERSSCIHCFVQLTVYILLCSVCFTISIVIGTIFIYFHWYLKKDMLNLIPILKYQIIKHANGKY